MPEREYNTSFYTFRIGFVSPAFNCCERNRRMNEKKGFAEMFKRKLLNDLDCFG